jgi:hypothetical protein
MSAVSGAGGVHDRFWAMRSMSTASASSRGGRPTRWGYVHFLAIRCRCQRGIIPGVTKRCRRRICGNLRRSAANTARSAQSGGAWGELCATRRLRGPAPGVRRPWTPMSGPATTAGSPTGGRSGRTDARTRLTIMPLGAAGRAGHLDLYGVWGPCRGRPVGRLPRHVQQTCIPLGAGPGAAGGLDRPSPLGGRSRSLDLGRCGGRHGHDPGAHRPAELRRVRHRRRRSGGVRLAPRSDLGSLRSQKRPGGGLTTATSSPSPTSTSLRCIRNVRPARPGTCRAAHGGPAARPGRRGRPSGSRSPPGKRNAPKALMV